MKINFKTILWCLCILATYWLVYTIYKIKFCSSNRDKLSLVADQALNDLYDEDDDEHDDIYNQISPSRIKKKKPTFKYSRNMPLIFVVGVQGSGLTLMRKLLNEIPNIRLLLILYPKTLKFSPSSRNILQNYKQINFY
jgi:hypothetical protein